MPWRGKSRRCRAIQAPRGAVVRDSAAAVAAELAQKARLQLHAKPQWELKTMVGATRHVG